MDPAEFFGHKRLIPRLSGPREYIFVCVCSEFDSEAADYVVLNLAVAGACQFGLQLEALCSRAFLSPTLRSCPGGGKIVGQNKHSSP
jgi:hypothetical protein